ncbi:MAG: hypothetical protein Ta2D_04920 [Rickettsiales bacterium]|nr:MAG: hypothetical protein Ta2D_04920 [Rickettsiales bacterium]
MKNLFDIGGGGVYCYNKADNNQLQLKTNNNQLIFICYNKAGNNQLRLKADNNQEQLNFIHYNKADNNQEQLNFIHYNKANSNTLHKFFLPINNNF